MINATLFLCWIVYLYSLQYIVSPLLQKIKALFNPSTTAHVKPKRFSE